MRSTGDAVRVRYVSLLQIAATIAIIGFHSGVRGGQAGWMAVEVFFVLAGLNMTRCFDRHAGVASYVLSRARRLAPEVGVVWVVAFALMALGWKSKSLLLFLLASPVFLQNFIEPFFDTGPDVNWIFLLSLWFVAALMQLSVLFYLLRKVIARYETSTLLGATLVLAFLGRIALLQLLGGTPRDLAAPVADTLYRMPLTHVEAVMAGILIGRGRLKGIGKYGPFLLLTMLGAGMANWMLVRPPLAIGSLGFPIGMPANYQYLWGYPLLALAAAAWCAPDGPLAALERLRLPARLDRAADALSRQTYGAYVFHGLILSAVWSVMRYGVAAPGPLARTVIFAGTTVGAFGAAWAFTRVCGWAAGESGSWIWAWTQSPRIRVRSQIHEIGVGELGHASPLGTSRFDLRAGQDPVRR
jgi:surface polysaccharide O-acyltransferase-like enzyme